MAVAALEEAKKLLSSRHQSSSVRNRSVPTHRAVASHGDCHAPGPPRPGPPSPWPTAKTEPAASGTDPGAGTEDFRPHPEDSTCGWNSLECARARPPTGNFPDDGPTRLARL